MSDNNVPQSGALQQQGTINWDHLAGSLVKFTVDALSRYSAANVDTYTLQIGQLICSQFELSAKGRQNVSDALMKLKSSGSFGNVLWFGFGLRHLVRDLQTTEQGFICLSLCTSLLECYHENLVSEVLNELTKTLKAPAELTPSVNQWNALLHACNGTLATTSFGQTLERLVQLNPHCWRETIVNDHLKREGCASPKSIAEVLRGIGAITQGRMVSMTVIGGDDAGFIAAIAEWLFDLRVLILDAASEQELHTSCAGKSPQVTVMFEPYQCGGQDRQNKAMLRCTGRTYYLEDATELFRLRSSGPFVAYVSGRARWDSLLGTVFGSEFDWIFDYQQQTLASAIGSAARLFRAVSSAEPGIPMQLVRDWRSYAAGSNGRGFVGNIIEWLPELASLKKPMERACQISLEEARTQYEHQIAKTQQICCCHICAPTEAKVGAKRQKFCKVVVIETIITLGLALSEMVVQQGLFPKRLGVEEFYHQQALKRSHPVRKDQGFHHQQALKRSHPVRKDQGYGALEIRSPNGKFLVMEELGPFYWLCKTRLGAEEKLKDCLTLFSGFRNYQVLDTLCAMSDNGICVYQSVFHDLSDDIEISGKVYIVAGNIEHLGKPFDRIYDEGQDVALPPEDMLEFVHTYTKANLLATEISTGLEVAYLLKCEDDETPPLLVKPCHFVNKIGHLSGWVYCQRPDFGVCPAVYSLPSEDANRPSQSIKVFDKEVRLIRGSKLSRCAAITISTYDWMHIHILKDARHCLDCYFRAAMTDSIASNYVRKVQVEDGEESKTLCIISGFD